MSSDTEPGQGTALAHPSLTSTLPMQVGCPESGIDEAVMRLTREGYKVCQPYLGLLKRGVHMPGLGSAAARQLALKLTAALRRADPALDVDSS